MTASKENRKSASDASCMQRVFKCYGHHRHPGRSEAARETLTLLATNCSFHTLIVTTQSIVCNSSKKTCVSCSVIFHHFFICSISQHKLINHINSGSGISHSRRTEVRRSLWVAINVPLVSPWQPPWHACDPSVSYPSTAECVTVPRCGFSMWWTARVHGDDGNSGTWSRCRWSNLYTWNGPFPYKYDTCNDSAWAWVMVFTSRLLMFHCRN